MVSLKGVKYALVALYSELCDVVSPTWRELTEARSVRLVRFEVWARSADGPFLARYRKYRVRVGVEENINLTITTL